MTPEGRIVWFEVDAQSGRILGMVTGTLPGPYGNRGQGQQNYPLPYAPGGNPGWSPYDNDGRPGNGRGNGGRGNGRGGRGGE
jgi:hypothetical protein